MKLYSFFRSQSHSLRVFWLVQGILIVLFIQSTLFQTVSAQIVDPDLLCQNASDFRCKAHRMTQQSTDSEHMDVQAEVQKPTPPQVIKFQLNGLNGVSEWIRAEVRGNQVKLLHTVVAESGVSRIIHSFIPIALAHTWYDHPTSRIIFQPDGCESNDCRATGTVSVMLPSGTDIYQGQFTLEYTESGWLRTITFKVPNQKKTARLSTHAENDRGDLD
jgi:hypothetical protein